MVFVCVWFYYYFVVWFLRNSFVFSNTLWFEGIVSWEICGGPNFFNLFGKICVKNLKIFIFLLKISYKQNQYSHKSMNIMWMKWIYEYLFAWVKICESLLYNFMLCYVIIVVKNEQNNINTRENGIMKVIVCLFINVNVTIWNKIE